MNKNLNLSGVYGMPFQSHYIPCDKPYKVYTFVADDWETRIAQQIGTMVIVKQDEDDEITYEYKPAFKFDDFGMYCTSERVVMTDSNDWFSDEKYLGNVGDTVGLDKIGSVLYYESTFGYTYMMPQEAIDMMERSGLKVDVKKDLPKDGILHLEASLHNNMGGYKGDREIKCFTLGCDREKALFGVRLNGEDYHPITHLARLINAWKELGVKDFEVDWEECDYIQNVDVMKELVSLAKQHSLHKLQFPNSIDYMIIDAVQSLNGEDCTLSEFVHAFNHDTKYNWNFDEKHVREYLEKADKEGLLKLDGDKITFSSHLSKMGKWKYE